MTKNGEVQKCLGEAGHLLEQGILFQACSWGVVPRAPGAPDLPDPRFARLRCEQAPDRDSALDKERAELLRDALDVANSLGKIPVDDAKKQLASLRGRAAPLAASGRGGFSVISQGGVSLGAWQGGYTFFLTEALKVRRDALVKSRHLPPSAAAMVTSTGASAGAINALVSGVEGCTRRPLNDPSATLFYDVWVNLLGFDPKGGGMGLLAENEDSKLAVFSSAPVEAAVRAAGRYAATLDQVVPDCSFNLGLDVTPLQSVRSPVHVDHDGKSLVSAPRLTERFVLRISPREGAVPLVENVSPPARPLLSEPARTPNNLFYAKLGDRDEVDFPVLLDAVRASGAYPVAFDPVALTYQSWDPEQGQQGEYRTHRDVLFVDGGTLDNAPIRLAATINDWQQPLLNNPWLSDLFQNPVTYVFVNPNVTSWEPHTKAAKEQKKSQAKQTIWSTYRDFVSELFATGLEAELASTAEQLEFIREQRDFVPRLSIPRRNMPIAGERLLHFMGFLNKDFRDFDFYVGAADAAKQLGELHDMREFSDAVRVRLKNEKLACLHDYYARALPDLGADFVKQPLPHAVNDWGIPSCAAIQERNFLALLVTMHGYKAWTLSAEYESEEEIDQFFELLQDAGFTFGQSELPADFDHDPTVAFRELAQVLVDRVASKHEGAAAWTMRVGGTSAADAWVLRWFPHFAWSFGVAMNGLELGLGYSPYAVQFEPDWGLRLDARARSYHWGHSVLRSYADADGELAQEERWMGRNSLYGGVSAVIGLPWFGSRMSPGFVDLELGFGATYEVAWAPKADGAAIVQKGWSWTPSARLVFLQRLYLAFEYSYYGGAFGHRDTAEEYEQGPPGLQWRPNNPQFSGGLRFPL